jgi:cysteine synthase
MPNQNENPLNVPAHYETTGREIGRHTDGRVTHLFVSLGTCGTAMGCGRYLKERNSAVKLVAVQPSEGHDVPGLRNLSELGVSPLFERSLVDELPGGVTSSWPTRALDWRAREACSPDRVLPIFEGATRVTARERVGLGVMIFPDNVFKYVSNMVRHVPDLLEGRRVV